MYDQYVEILIKRKTMQGLDKIKSTFIILMIVTLIIGVSVANVFFLIATVILGFVYYFKILRLDVEFEYYYMNGELDIAQIFNKSKRKQVVSLNEGMIEIIAPAGTEEIQLFNLKNVIDCSANDPTRQPYAIICYHENKLKKVLIQMNDELLDALKKQMPGKVRKEI